MSDPTPLEKRSPLAPLVLKLLTGPVAREDSRWWSELLAQRTALADWFRSLGLDLRLHESEGLAYLSQPEAEDDPDPLPRLVKRQALNFESTLLLIVLRELIEEHDAGEAGLALEVTVEDLKERLLPYWSDRQDEVRLTRVLERSALTLGRLGFLRDLGEAGPEGRRFEVSRLVKVKITPEVLGQLKGRIQAYVDAL